MKLLTIPAAMLLSSSAVADTYIDVNLAAYHFNREVTAKSKFREVNPGIGLEYIKGNVGYMAGTFVNSVNRQSTYVMVSNTPVHISNMHVGVVGGAITGYKDSVVPIGGVLVSFRFKQAGINLVFVPEVQRMNVYGFVGVQLMYKFDLSRTK